MITVGDPFGEVETKADPAARKRDCSVCGAKLEPIFKATRKAEDWFWRECDICDMPVCKDCSDEDEDGSVECTDCYQSAKWCKREEL